MAKKKEKEKDKKKGKKAERILSNGKYNYHALWKSGGR